MANLTCNICKAKNEYTSYFCCQCGKFLKSEEFNNESYELPEMKIIRILENLQQMAHSTIIWDNAVDLYTTKIEKMKALFALPGMGAEKNFAICNKMAEFLDLCYKPEFQIAFVGTIKTGKSTLINSLLGKNYASMAVTPETAALTKFRASIRDYVHVVFYTKDEWKKLWDSRTSAADAFVAEYNELNADRYEDRWIGHEPIRKELASDDIEKELSVWSSSKSPEHYFVKEIEIGISTLPKNFPQQVVLVDTPGLSDPVAYRSELTREYIRRANAVFVCVDAQKIQKEEIETISSVFSFSSHNKNKVHIIATHWDKLNNPDEDWQEQKGWLAKQLTGKAFYDTREMAYENIMHSAAYIFNLCRDYKMISQQEKKSLRKFALDYDYELPDDLEKIKDNTNIASIVKVVQDKLAGKYQEILIQDIKSKYDDIVGNLHRVVQDKKDDTMELLEASTADIDSIKQKVAEQQVKYDEIYQVSAQLTQILGKVSQDTKKRMEVICGKLRLQLYNTAIAGKKKQ